MSTDYSRTELLASKTTTVASDLLSHLEQQVVVVTCDADPAMIRGARTLLTILRRLPVALVFDGTGIDTEQSDAIRTAVASVDPDRPLHENAKEGVRVHIGLEAPLGTLRVVPSQHGAHVVRDGRTIMAKPASPLGSCMAAALAAAEVFKDVVCVRADRRSDLPYYAFCPVTLSVRPEDAPPLALPFRFSGALVGLGAIGSATAMILGELDTRGNIDLVDRQKYATENVTTYSLGGQPDVAASVWKTELAERALRAAHCERFDNGIEDYVSRVQNGALTPPRIVVAGLDSVEARHETQRLWPDLLIDGGTGDTMLGLHVVEGVGQPCMMCFLPLRTGPSPYDILAELTGLPITKLRDGDAILREEDLSGVSAEQRKQLAGHIGKKICGLVQVVGLTDIPADGFQPSAAFVSLAAACLVVGRLVARELHVEPAASFVQYDALFGPDGATVEERTATPNCYCVTRANTIVTVRDRRRFSSDFIPLRTPALIRIVSEPST
ncbi:MAG: hypothetical protein QOC81_843 [Thermoanaerobaculia bacterium]|jgi:hypothetical protein|nr:hypothetical protein [Thermoanaerobaculia bacterium]